VQGSAAGEGGAGVLVRVLWAVARGGG
jgi:hypothetical protein